jgi:hypothetical protein
MPALGDRDPEPHGERVQAPEGGLQARFLIIE